MALLVALHWENALVVAAIAVLGNGPLKGAMQPLEAVFEDVFKADQQRQLQIAALQSLHQLHQIQRSTAITAGLHQHMAAGIDAEIGITPLIEPIELSAGGWRPVLLFHLAWGHHHRRRPSIHLMKEM